MPGKQPQPKKPAPRDPILESRPKKSTLSSVPKYEKDPRWPKFVEKLMQLQNAAEACRQAGYAESTALKVSYLMSARVLQGMKAALWRQGMAVDRMAGKLVQLFDAKEPKWNAGTERWNYFENTGAQIAAFDRIKAVLEPEPPKKLEVDVLIGVKRDETRDKETAEEWEARNAERRAAATKVGQALISAGVASSQTGQNGQNGSNGSSKS